MAASETDSSSGELAAQILQPLLGYIRDHHGDDEVARVLDEAGLQEQVLEPAGRWVSVAQVCDVLRELRGLVSDDRAFADACAYKLWDAYGGMLLLVRAAATPSTLYRMMAATMGHVSKVSTYQARDVTGRSATMIYRTEAEDESRLLCLSRQAQIVQGPVPWGVPPAKLHEKTCVCWGDDACTYELEWQELFQKGKLYLAALLGGAAAAALVLLASVPWLPALLGFVTIMGGTVAWEYRRLLGVSRDQMTSARDDYQQTWQGFTEAQRELLDLHDEQRRWNDVLEARIAERTGTLQSAVKRLKDTRAQDQTAVLSVTHDLANILGSVSANSQILLESLRGDSLEDAALDVQASAATLEVLLAELMEVARREMAPRALSLSTMTTNDIVERAKRRLNALLIGRDIRVSVFRTREAPEEIVTDVRILHRVLDNLLTNACKYTERGSIILEVDGVPDFLCLKLSDTGRGIAESRIEAVLSATSGPDPSADLGKSHGIGLSNVVRLLDSVGGRLEVLSRDGIGSTFWVYVPKVPAAKQRAAEYAPIEEVLERVVKIRATLN